MLLSNPIRFEALFMEDDAKQDEYNEDDYA